MTRKYYPFSWPILLIGIIIIILTWVICWPDLNYPATVTHVDLFAFAVLIAAEIVFTIGVTILIACKLPVSPIVSIIGIPPILFAFLIISFALYFFRGQFYDNPRLFYNIQVTVISITLCLLILNYTFARYINSTDKRTSEETYSMIEIEGRLANLTDDSENSLFKDILKDIYEQAKYADRVGISTKDRDISAAVDDLELMLKSPEDTREAAVNDAAAKVKKLLDERKVEIAQSKRGAF